MIHVKCLISKINNSYNSTNEQITQLKNGLSRHFYKEDTQMANSQMKDDQHHQENASQNHSKILHITNVGKEKRKTLTGGSVNWCSHYGRVWLFPKNLKIELLYDLAVSFLSIYPKKYKH